MSRSPCNLSEHEQSCKNNGENCSSQCADDGDLSAQTEEYKGYIYAFGTSVNFVDENDNENIRQQTFFL